MNETQVKYLAGLLDADGSLSFAFKRADNNSGRFYVGLALRLSASDAIDHRGFVSSLPETHGFGSVCRSGKHKHISTWSVSKRSDLEMLIPRLAKHMVIKARHWDWMLRKWREIRAGGASVSDAERAMLTDASKASRRDGVGPLKAKVFPTWAWLAGYVDGDGWYVHRKYYNRRWDAWNWAIKMGVVAHKNDACGLDLIQQSHGGYIRPHTQSDDLRVWHLNLGPANASLALRFLPNLAKHSQMKRDKIDAIIHHHRQRLSVPGATAQAIV